jgi:mono/diheme cytochrome c family protein
MKNFRLRRISAGGTLFILGALGAWAQPDAKDLFLDKCAACHGADGAGQTAKGKKLKMTSVKTAAAKMSAEDMIKVVQNGKGADMDAYGNTLNKDQIKALVDYYRSLAK